MKRYRVGIDVGGTKIAYGIFDEDNKLIDRIKHPSPVEADGPAFSDVIIDNVSEFLEKNSIGHNEVSGIGICMPSHIIFDEGYIVETASLANVRDFAMVEYVKKHFDIPVILDNDANVAALAESRFGAGRGARDMVYMATSTGIGGGLILNGNVYRGSYGFSGEVGHMLITPDEGITCGCGNAGCFESWAGGRNIPERTKMFAKGKKTCIDLNSKINGEVLLSAVKAGDEVANAVLEKMAVNLGLCIYNIYQVLNVKLFVFGGGLTNFGSALYDRSRETFDKYNHIDLPVEWKFAEAKDDFGIIGAAELVREII